MSSPFNDKEQQLFDDLISLNDKFIELGRDLKDVNTAIHILQDVVIRSSFSRLFPELIR